MRLARTAAPPPRIVTGGAGKAATSLHVSACAASPPPKRARVWPAGVEPAISGSRSRRGTVSPTTRCKRRTPGGSRTRTSGLRAPASSPFDHGSKVPTTRLRRQGSNLPLAINSRASYPLDHAGTRRKERESNPQGPEANPFSRRDTAPMAVLPRSGPGRRRTCTVPGKSRELCRIELRSRAM